MSAHTPYAYAWAHTDTPERTHRQICAGETQAAAITRALLACRDTGSLARAWLASTLTGEIVWQHPAATPDTTS